MLEQLLTGDGPRMGQDGNSSYIRHTAASVRKMAEVHGISKQTAVTKLPVSYNGGRIQSICLLKVRELYINAINPLALELDIYSLANHLCKM